MKKRLLCSAIVAALSLPALVLAQDTSPAQEPAPNTGPIHFGADLNFTTSYFFRGYNQEDIGLIFQPNVYAYTELLPDADPDSAINSLRIKGGSWNSLHSEKSGPDGDIWYEEDIYGVATATFAGGVYVNVGYTAYTYPSDVFGTTQELGLSVGYDDSKFWTDMGHEGFALHPEVGVYKEISDRNGDQETYGEVKITPGLTIDKDMIPGFGKAAVSFPVVLGVSVDQYYLDSDGGSEFFGYLQGGVAVSLPMTFVPARYGSWNLVGGVNYIQMLADSVEISNDGGEHYEVQGTIGVSMTY